MATTWPLRAAAAEKIEAFMVTQDRLSTRCVRLVSRIWGNLGKSGVSWGRGARTFYIQNPSSSTRPAIAGFPSPSVSLVDLVHSQQPLLIPDTEQPPIIPDMRELAHHSRQPWVGGEVGEQGIATGSLPSVALVVEQRRYSTKSRLVQGTASFSLAQWTTFDPSALRVAGVRFPPIGPGPGIVRSRQGTPGAGFLGTGTQ